MKTESDKFKKSTVSHHDNCGDSACTLPDTNTPDTNTSGKWWEKPAQEAITTGLDILSGLFGGSKNSAPAPAVNTTPPAPDNTALYVGIGAGSLVFLVVILALLKK